MAPPVTGAHKETEMTLYIRDSESRRYRRATHAEIVYAAPDAANALLGERPYLDSPSQVQRLIHARLVSEPSEQFFCIYLDARHRIITSEVAFQGTIDGASVYPREIVRRALELNAASLLVAHNHPSGNPEPSAADRAVTRRIKDALQLVDMRLLDHVVVGTDGTCSFAERGLL